MKSLSEMDVRMSPLRREHAGVVSKLLLSQVHGFLLAPDGAGAQPFFDSLTPDVIANYEDTPQFDYRTAWHGVDLVGVIALRHNHHLFHLFVAPDWQGRGLGRALWDAIQVPSSERYTVNASRNAVGFYMRLGFVATGPEQQGRGVAWTPMAYDCH